MDAEQLGKDIVLSQRKARFADTTPEQWAERLTHLIESQPKIDGPIKVSDVRPVGTAAGGSNGTMLFNAGYFVNGELQERNLVLRFLPAEGLFHSYDVVGQFRLQETLGKTNVPVPEQLWLDSEGTHLKVPGYVMSQVPGEGPPMVWKASGLIAEADPELRRQMTTDYVAHLAKIHSLDWKGLELDWLEQRASGTHPIERETNWYWDGLNWANFEDSVQQLSPVRDWLIANEPDDVDVVLCHGDANLGNYLFQDGKVTAVLDWEMAFIGAPEADVAFLAVGDTALQGHLPMPEGALTYKEMYEEYERITSKPLKHMEYFELFTAYRVSVITTLAMKHYPDEMTQMMRPIYDTTLKLCFDRAEKLGVSL